MATVADVCRFLESFAPTVLAEDWDNVGLLLGDRQSTVHKVMTCLTVTGEVVDEAVAEQVDFVVTHHPIPFKGVKRISTDSHTGSLLWRLASNGIAVYSPHTAFDSAPGGINQQLAEGLALEDIRPLIPLTDTEGDERISGLGTGRVGHCSVVKLHELVNSVASFLQVDGLHVVGDKDLEVTKVGIGCGSAGEFIRPASRAGCQVLLTGEARFHTCLEAESLGMAMILPGHYASERFAVETLAISLAEEFSDLSIWASRQERDPLGWQRKKPDS